MMTEKRLEELSARGDCCSDFLTLDQQSCYFQLLKKPGFRPGFLDGGYPEAERKVVCFDLPAAPIALLSITLQGRCPGSRPGHRDYLGALMGLGVKRETLGDLLVLPDESGAMLFCLERIAPYLVENLNSAGRFSVSCERADGLPEGAATPGKEYCLTVSSLRLDNLAAAAFALSRGQSTELIRGGAVFEDGRLIKKPDHTVSVGSRITVRGKGRFLLKEIRGHTKKERIAVVIEK